jgi:8-oxo-dGTP pyrophosphatase MutT (NUDIX family)
MSAEEPLDVVTAPWTQLTTRVVYENPWIRVDEDHVRLPNGHQTIYGVVRCADAVGVLPFVDEDHVLLVQQYRYVAGHPTWEMPTGGRHGIESLEETAQRELAEEAGHRAGRLEFLTRFHSSKSVVDETVYLFVARDLVSAVEQPDETELIRRQIWSFDEVVQMVHAAQITDAMTVVAVLFEERRRRTLGY